MGLTGLKEIMLILVLVIVWYFVSFTFHEDIPKSWILALDGDFDDHSTVECIDALFLSILELAESKQKANESLA